MLALADPLPFAVGACFGRAGSSLRPSLRVSAQLRDRVPEYLIVIEGELPDLRERDPASIAGVVTAARGPASPAHVKRDGGRRLSRIPVRPRVDPDQAIGYRGQAGLLPQFPNHRVLDGLALFHEAAGKRPLSSEWRSTPLDEQDAAALDPHRVDGQGGVLVLRGHRTPEEPGR
jgi:hypothetical protein